MGKHTPTPFFFCFHILMLLFYRCNNNNKKKNTLKSTKCTFAHATPRSTLKPTNPHFNPHSTTCKVCFQHAALFVCGGGLGVGGPPALFGQRVQPHRRRPCKSVETAGGGAGENDDTLSTAQNSRSAK
jgi:hypothetical protein